MNRYVEKYKKLRSEFPDKDRLLIFKTIASIIATIGNINDLKALDAYYTSETNEILGGDESETNKIA